MSTHHLLVRALLAISTLTLVAFALDHSAEAAADAKARVLIVTGDDVGVHDWLSCSAKAREFLNDSGKSVEAGGAHHQQLTLHRDEPG